VYHNLTETDTRPGQEADLISPDNHAGFRILTQGGNSAKTPLILVAAMLLLSAGCGGKEQDLRVDQLTPGELTYVTRIVTLERAKAVTLVDRTTGDALLDSLAAAWGDSSLERTLAGMTTDPVRARQVNELLQRLLTAEQDSLVKAPRPDRLQAPLPTTLPEIRPESQSGY